MKIVKYLGLIGLAVFAYIIWAIGIGNIVQGFERLNLAIFALALLTLIPNILLKAYKQSLLINAFGARLGIIESAKIWLIGFFFSAISPGKTGDAIKCFYFADKTGISAGKGLSAVVVERFFDVAVLFALTLIGLLVISSHLVLGVDMLTPILALFAAFIAIAWLLTKKQLVFVLIKPFYKFLIPKKFGEKAKGGFHEFFEGVKIFKSKKGLMAFVFMLTVLHWVLAAFQYYLLAISLALPVSFEFIFMVMPIVNLLGTLPIAFNGIGTREASLVFFFALISLPAGEAVSFSLLVFLLTIILGGVGFAFTLGEKKAVI